MIEIGPLVFTQPFLLFSLLLLPGLALLLRVTPPAARAVRFPPMRLLAGLRAKRDEMAKTPPWLLLLRLAIATLAILGFAHPLYNPAGGFTDRGPVILVVDDGWASAAHWETRRHAMETIVGQAERRDRPILLITTAPPRGQGAKALADPRQRLMAAREARELIRTLAPKPWPVDRRRVLAALKDLQLNSGALAIWLADGIDDGAAGALAERLQAFGRLDVVLPTALESPLLLHPPEASAEGLTLSVEQYGDAPPVARRIGVLAQDEAGVVLARQGIDLGPGERVGSALLALPTEVRNRVAALRIEGEASAAALVLVDERWRRRPVGLVSRDVAQGGLPLLGDLYFLERALNADAEVRIGTIEGLLERDLTMMALADIVQLSPEERTALTAWVEAGGVLVRFAGPHMGGARIAGAASTADQGDDPLLPVPLRNGERSLGGSLSWQKPLTVKGFSEHGPFAGLPVPGDVTVTTQILTEPVSGLDLRSWASLSDGTPLVTGAPLGKGRVVLFHTSAGPDWSSLPMSGTFPRLLKRLLEMGQGVGGTPVPSETMPPIRVVDGLGRLTAPDGSVLPVRHDEAVGPTHPPGYYGRGAARRALNLSPSVAPFAAMTVPRGAFSKTYDSLEREADVKPWLLAAALALLLADTTIALWIKGIVGLPAPVRRLARLGVLAAGLLVAGPVVAADDPIDPTLRAAALETRLAYVKTGDPALDAIAASGLTALTRVLAERTAAELAPPMAVDIERDVLVVFPLLYWPVGATARLPAQATSRKLDDYMRNGGMILFDTRDGGASSLLERDATAGALKGILAGLEIPALVPLPPAHVLNRSFYLLGDQPGRIVGGAVWIARDATGRDGVTPVIIGSNDWIGAWARDDRTDEPLLPVVPGDERQREMAFRFGINVVMHALTGNYKADQVHMPAILERLTQ